MEEIFRYKKDILSALDKCLDTDNQNSWKRDVFGRLKEYTKGGKLIRGCLILYAFEMFDKSKSDFEAVPLAVALELTQAAFLIHDDIMDRDKLRRGLPSIHVQYQKMLRDRNTPDWEHSGESLAICAGDAAIFFAYEQISKLSCGDQVKNKIIRLLSIEWQRVCYGQMQDVWYGVGGEVARTKEILGMYRDKTARYTFSVPLVTGAMLANQADQILMLLDGLGEKIGILFQVRDDELNLDGEVTKTGKPTGSDIRENKQTYLRSVKFDKQVVYELMDQLEWEAREIISQLPIEAEKKTELNTLVSFVRNREK